MSGLPERVCEEVVGQEHLRRVHPDSDQTIRGEEANWEEWLKTLSRDESLAVYAQRFRQPSDSDVELDEDLPPLPVATAESLEPPLPVTAEEPKPVKKSNHKPLIVRIPKLAIKVPEKMVMLEIPVEMDFPKIGKIELEVFEEMAPIVPEDLAHPELELLVQDNYLELQEDGSEQASKVRKVDSGDFSAQLKQAVREAVEPLHTKIFNLEKKIDRLLRHTPQANKGYQWGELSPDRGATDTLRRAKANPAWKTKR